MKATGGKAEKQCQVQSGAQCQQPASESPLGSSPSCPFIPPPLFMRAQPLPPRHRGQRGLDAGLPTRQPTAGLRTRRPCHCHQGPEQPTNGCYRRTLAGCPGLSCSFCKMGAQCEPSGLAMRGVAELVEGGCWDGNGPRPVLTSSSQTGPGRV